MRTIRWKVLVLAAAAATLAWATWAEGAYVPPAGKGPHAVGEWTAVWTDAARGRDIPVRITYPSDARGPFPVIVFSHGLGGSRDGYRYLGECWASHGYVSVHIQHPGSDAEVLKSLRPYRAMQKAAKDPDNILNRPKDVSFAIDRLTALNVEAGWPLRGKLDLSRLGVGGHSFGAYTALAASGRVLIGARGGRLDLSDPRIMACVAMSAPARSRERDCPSYARFVIPCLHMTGTEDKSPIGDTTAAQRRIPFDCIPAHGQYLVTFKGADHMVFSGRAFARPRPDDGPTHERIETLTLAFWDATLRGDAQAKAWLASGAGAWLGGAGTWETK